MVDRWDKWVLDLTLILLAAPIALPLLAALALATWAIQGSPVLFRQQRPGLHGKPFTIYKFRTMRQLPPGVAADAKSDGQRLTRFGKLLRSTSLDELPELINVLKGDMSLVGPRPEEERIVARYDAHQRRRLKAKPGLTGLQQVEARGVTSLEERIRLDVIYLRRRTFVFDLWILARTAWTVVTGRGAR